jgi:hypothetical protein
MENMLKSLVMVKKEKARVFQVLLLDNDANEDVEVQESKNVDFARVEKHLAQGGSVFITSKNSQKLAMPRDKTERNKNKKKVKGFYFNHV